MLVIADSSPLRYLILIDYVDVLPALFGQIVIPDKVRTELTHPSTPVRVRELILGAPVWLVVKVPGHVEVIPEIDDREQAAISLVRELQADLLLIDDRDGRFAATQRGISIIGTIGVLETAARHGLLDLKEAFARIRKTAFRVSDALIAETIKRHEQHKSNPQA